MNTEQYAAAVMNYAKDAQNTLEVDSSEFLYEWEADMGEGKRRALEDLIDFLHDLNKAQGISLS